MSKLSHYIKLRNSAIGCDAKQFECDKYLDCDSCLEDKIKEHDKQIRTEVINEYYNKINEKLKTDTNLKDTIREIHDNVAQEMYCKGIDDLCNEISTYRMYDEYGNVIDLLEIAEKLKENK